jgi:hypothetical protein
MAALPIAHRVEALITMVAIVEAHITVVAIRVLGLRQERPSALPQA